MMNRARTSRFSRVAACLRVVKWNKTAKSEQTWQKLDDTDTASVDPGRRVGGRRFKRKLIKRQEPPTVAGEPNSDVGLKKELPRDLWENRDYYWVVVCKNDGFHHRDNQFYVHRIPLAETDAVSPRPAIDQRFLVRCDECGEEYVYKPSEVLRYDRKSLNHSLRIRYSERRINQVWQSPHRPSVDFPESGRNGLGVRLLFYSNPLVFWS